MIDMGDDSLNARLAVRANTIYYYTSMANGNIAGILWRSCRLVLY